MEDNVQLRNQEHYHSSDLNELTFKIIPLPFTAVSKINYIQTISFG